MHLFNCQFDEGPRGPKLSWDYTSEMGKCDTGKYSFLHYVSEYLPVAHAANLTKYNNAPLFALNNSLVPRPRLKNRKRVRAGPGDEATLTMHEYSSLVSRPF